MDGSETLQEGQGDAPEPPPPRRHRGDTSSTLAMLNGADTAETDSDTEAAQEVAQEALGLGGENFAAGAGSAALQGEPSVVSNETSGRDGDDHSLVQGAHSAFQGAAAAAVPGPASEAQGEVNAAVQPALSAGPLVADGRGGGEQQQGDLVSLASGGGENPVPAGPPVPPAEPHMSAALIEADVAVAPQVGEIQSVGDGGFASPAVHSQFAAAAAAEPPQPIMSEHASVGEAFGGGDADAAVAGPAILPAESVGMPASAIGAFAALPPQYAGNHRVHAPGISITSNAGPPFANLNAEVASARWRAAPLRAGSIDARAAASTDAQIGSFAVGGREAAADDAAATQAGSGGCSEDSQAGSGGRAVAVRRGAVPAGASNGSDRGHRERAQSGGPAPAQAVAAGGDGGGSEGPSDSARSGESNQDGAGSPRRYFRDREHSSHRSGGGRGAAGHSRAFANGAASGGGAAGSPTLQQRSGSTQPNGSIGSPSGVQQPSRKRKRPASPSEEVAFKIRDAAKANDPGAALAAYDAAVVEGIPLRPESFNSLLYLCAGGEHWAMPGDAAQQQAGDGSDGRGAGGASSAAEPDVAARYTRGGAILRAMEQQGIKATEVAYTSIARLAAAAGDADAALSAARKVVDQGLVPRLRTFVPALMAFAAHGQVDRAFEVDAAVADLGIDLTEAEYAQLLAACVAGNAPWASTEGVLKRMGRELTTLQDSTLEVATKLFRRTQSPAGPPWTVERCTVDDTGVASNGAGQLAGIDLDDAEWQAFGAGIARLARERERRPNDFDHFLQWLEEHGPFGVLIDGSNLALYGQNWAHGGFDFAQIGAAYDHAVAQFPDLKPLVVMHAGRTKAPEAQAPKAAALLERWRRSKTFYASPFGSNDDWYWMFAAVKAGREGLLISNDEMRDHIFQLLAPKFFYKWKQRHQVKYSFGLGGFQAEHPPPYTTCVQQLPGGAWLLPSVGGDWLCARPTS